MGAAYRSRLCPEYRPRQCSANSLIYALRSNPLCTLRLKFKPRLCPACSLIYTLRSNSVCALRINPACARQTVAIVACVHTPSAPCVKTALVLCSVPACALRTVLNIACV
jgi:hypothetical protein